MDPSHTITRPEDLQALFGPVGEASLRKEVGFIHPVYRRWIEASPFVVLATSGPQGLDASPRGDPAGCVVVEDEHTLLLPERRGNNRIDSLRNILADPHVALLFLIPGIGETLRVNGRAAISVDPELLARFEVNGKLPRSVLVISVDTVFFQCSRAIFRSKLWDPAQHIERSSLPSLGRMVAEISRSGFDAESYDKGLYERLKGSLY